MKVEDWGEHPGNMADYKGSMGAASLARLDKHTAAALQLLLVTIANFLADSKSSGCSYSPRPAD